MNWFLAKLVFRVFCGTGNHIPQFDEQLRLIYAEDELHAFHKARLLGEGDTKNIGAESMPGVQWKFIDVTELHALTQFVDGAEIYAVIKEEKDADLYIRTIKKTATQLLQNCLHHFTQINNILIGT
ncbi:MAG: DUF4288 domain-containing protein [Ferruginibacter sp.]